MVPEGCPSENSALAPTLKFPLDLQKKGVDAADVSQTTRISAQIYNAADEEVTMQTQLQFFGGDTANAQSHTLAPGWNTVLISVDAQILGLSYDIFDCKGLLFAFGLSEEAPTLYMDDIILYRTETPYTPMEITLDEYEICSFDKLYQQYVIVPYNRFENYIPEVSLNTDVAYARNGRSLRVMMLGNDGSFQTGNSSSYSYTGFSLSAGFMEEVHMEQYPEEDDEYTYNFSFWVYNAGSSQQRLFIHFYNADGDVYKSVTDIYVPAGEWEEVSIPLSELTAGTSNTSYRNSGEIYINWEINTLLEDPRDVLRRILRHAHPEVGRRYAGVRIGKDMKTDVSFWNYTRLSAFRGRPRDAVAEWEKLGINVGFSFRYDPNEDSRDEMIALIEECERRNMKLIVYDARIYSPPEGFDEREYAARVSEAAEDFGKFPAVAGFYLGDEPTKAQFGRYRKALKILSDVTDRQGFMNFSWCDAHLKDFSGREEYADYLTSFAEETGLKLISNDRYSCLHARDYEPGFRETGTDKYFADLNLFRKVASACGAKFWTSLCAVGHWMYPHPGRDGHPLADQYGARARGGGDSVVFPLPAPLCRRLLYLSRGHLRRKERSVRIYLPPLPHPQRPYGKGIGKRPLFPGVAYGQKLRRRHPPARARGRGGVRVQRPRAERHSLGVCGRGEKEVSARQQRPKVCRAVLYRTPGREVSHLAARGRRARRFAGAGLSRRKK